MIWDVLNLHEESFRGKCFFVVDFCNKFVILNKDFCVEKCDATTQYFVFKLDGYVIFDVYVIFILSTVKPAQTTTSLRRPLI